jgi:hypothetical protein
VEITAGNSHDIAQAYEHISLTGRRIAHATTVPSFFKARLWKPPAAMATTPLKPGGTFVWPELLSPHATTVPLFISAKL